MLKWAVTGIHRFQPSYNSMGKSLDSPVRGSDPLLQTARGKLQNQRSKLNDQINRELRLRAGAENLYKATSNKKLKDTVALELSYVNSNLQLLKEELADLNSSVHVYQNERAEECAPMLPLGLKETKEVDFMIPFSDYIRKHYHEDERLYEEKIQELTDVRQGCRTPMRSEAGIELLFTYYNQLYFIEKRFFSFKSIINCYFEWYDSLTGVPTAQRTVGFEKGSILFNIGALYTQIAARQDRTNHAGVTSAISYFQLAAGAFEYLEENFNNAPSMDMQPKTLKMLSHLMLAQGQECVLEKQLLSDTPSSMEEFMAIAQEAAMVADMFEEVHRQMTSSALRDYVPSSWVSMIQVKQNYFSALAHYYMATSLLDQHDSSDLDKLSELFTMLHVHMNGYSRESIIFAGAPTTQEDRKLLAKGHLRQSVINLEEAIRIHSLSKQLRRMDSFQDMLRQTHDRSLLKFSQLEEEDDFSELMPVPSIKARTSTSLDAIRPDFPRYKVTDLFQELGPLAIFSAKHEWSKPRMVDLNKKEGEDFGFSVRGDSPVIIAMVDEGSLAARGGMSVGDFLVAVDGQDVKWSKHEEVVSLIKKTGPRLRLSLVTPLDRNYLQPTPPEQNQGPRLRSQSVPPTEGSRSPDSNNWRKDRKSKENQSGKSWTLLRKRSASREKKHGIFINGNSKDKMR